MFLRGKKFTIVAGIVVLLGVLVTLWFSWRPASSEVGPVPKDNGYDDIIAAGKMIVSDVPDSDSTFEKLRDFISKNREALQRVRVGLAKECVVPLVYANYFATHMDDLKNTKKMAKALFVEAKVAELENRPADAARTYLEMIRLGYQADHGGWMIHSLVASACETMGVTPLQQLVPQLNAQQCRELEKLELTREPFEKMAERERKFFNSQLHSWQGFSEYVGEIIEKKSLNPLKATLDKYEGKLQRRHQQTATLNISIASRIFLLEQGRKPKRVEELVPRFLTHIPVVQQTKTNLASPFF